MGLFDRLLQYGRLARVDKPVGSLLLLWPTLWAVWIAGDGRPSPAIALIFFVGVFITRSAGCVVNDLSDRKFDPFVDRTRDRPLASGKVSLPEAVAVLAVLALAAVGLMLLLNPFAIKLAFVGAAITVVYPLMKRVTHLPQLVLGVAFAWGIPMAFAAQTNTLPLQAWWLLAANLAWVVAYDTLYAMSDREDDLKIGVKSTAILLGRADLPVVAFLHVLSLAMLAGLGAYLGLNGYFYLGLAGALLLAIYQWAISKERDRDLCFQAFKNNTWLGASVFCGLLLSYL